MVTDVIFYLFQIPFLWTFAKKKRKNLASIILNEDIKAIKKFPGTKKNSLIMRKKILILSSKLTLFLFGERIFEFQK